MHIVRYLNCLSGQNFAYIVKLFCITKVRISFVTHSLETSLLLLKKLEIISCTTICNKSKYAPNICQANKNYLCIYSPFSVFVQKLKRKMLSRTLLRRSVKPSLTAIRTNRSEPWQGDDLMEIGARSIFSEEHDMFRESVRKFFNEHVTMADCLGLTEFLRFDLSKP